MQNATFRCSLSRFIGQLKSPATIVGAACFLQAFDTNAVVVALPDIAHSFGREALSMKEVVTAYLVGAIAVLPVCAWTADRFGARRTFLFALALFGVSAALCALATSIPFLLAARALEGCAAALLLPVGRILVLRSIPEDRMVAAMASLTLPMMLGPLLGPSLGGLIVSVAGWRALFIVMLPIAAAGFVLVLWFIPAAEVVRRRPFDARGAILLVAALVSLSVGVDAVAESARGRSTGMLLLPIGVALLGGYLLHERRVKNAVLDLGSFRHLGVRVSNIGGVFVRMLVGGSPFLLALLFQISFGYTAAETGTLILVVAVGSIVGRSFAALAVERVGYRPLLVLNGLFVAGTVAGCALLTRETPIWATGGLLFFQGAFRSIQLICVAAISYLGLRTDEFSAVSTISSISQQFAQVVGISVSVLVLNADVMSDAAEGGREYSFAFIFLAALSLVSLFWFVALEPGRGRARF